MKKKYLFTWMSIFLFLISIAQIQIDSGLVTYYPFNGNAIDESGYGNNGTVFGASLTSDRFGVENSAYLFDGDDYIKAMADSLPSAERTICLWFNAVSLDTKPCLLAYGGHGSPGTSWWMNLNHGNTAAYFLGFHYNQGNYLKYFYENEPVNEWVFFVTTTDSSGCRIFINTEEKASNDNFVTNTYVQGRDLAIGACVSGNGAAPFTDSNIGYFKGVIDDVRVYNRLLSNDEIAFLFDSVTSMLPPANIELNNSLYQNSPNPFKLSTEINFYISDQSIVSLNVYDLKGKLVYTLLDQVKVAGYYSVSLDAHNFKEGIYLYSLKTNKGTITRKMLVSE